MAKNKIKSPKTSKPMKKKKNKKTWKSVKEKRNKVKSEVTEIVGVSKKKSGVEKPKKLSLRTRMLERLNIAKFRKLNEESSNSDALGLESDFKSYHLGLNKASSNWKSHPLDWIIRFINENVDESKIIGDFGCGDGRLSKSINHVCHSFDLHALNDSVTQCDVRNTPLDNESLNVVVFCLSLMGIDVFDYINEASRVLKNQGYLIVAETCSKLQNTFVVQMKKCGFSIHKEHTLQNHLFSILVFKKFRRVIGKHPLTLNQTVYKKR
ncbi:unnamed protein product [Orchesella dallaii]|uniref:Ribosomal RNA-processing protein 8 n=1 Tax=Orchesella dallaii TaxID=48710 RepID=A0ABP1QX54_9HEXA